MKTMILLIGVFCICTIGMAQQQHAAYPQLKPGISYTFQTPEGELIIEGYTPNFDPHSIASIKSAFLIPIDGSGPIALDPTAVFTINPIFNLVLDNMYDPTPDPLRKKIINPHFVNEIDKLYDPTPDPGGARE